MTCSAVAGISGWSRIGHFVLWVGRVGAAERGSLFKGSCPDLTAEMGGIHSKSIFSRADYLKFTTGTGAFIISCPRVVFTHILRRHAILWKYKTANQHQGSEKLDRFFHISRLESVVSIQIISEFIQVLLLKLLDILVVFFV